MFNNLDVRPKIILIIFEVFNILIFYYYMFEALVNYIIYVRFYI